MMRVIAKGFLAIVSILQISMVDSVAYNALCTSDTQCTETNEHTYCELEVSPTCQEGKCRCEPIYEWESGKCKLKKFYLDPCDINSTCTEATVCREGMCSCSTGIPFNENLRKCTSLKAVGENCGNVANCYSSVADSVECVAPSGSSQTVCTCKAGYKEGNGVCRKPKLDEVCTSEVGCAGEFTGLDASIAHETCGNLACICPEDTTTEEKILISGRVSKICLTMPSSGSTLLSILDVCTQANQCSSKICYVCPEFTDQQQKKCVDQPTFY